MKLKKNLRYYLSVAVAIIASLGLFLHPIIENDDFVSYSAPPGKICLYFKNDSGKRIGSLKNLRKHVEAKGDKLLFGMNGGMYDPERSPLGLYIEDGKIINESDTNEGEGNFYMKPNGIFYIDNNNNALVTATENYKGSEGIKFATQSGPVLVIDGNIHPRFQEGSKNTNIRNGVGILPDGNVLLAMSKDKINFYDFAAYFKEKGCKNALYLDGLVSRTYAPSEDWIQEGGNFGVIIGVIE